MKNNTTFNVLDKEIQIVFLTFILGLSGFGIWSSQSNNFASSSLSSSFFELPESLPMGVAMCGTTNETQANIEPVQSGRWSDASTWPGGNFPSETDDVTIPSNINVTLVGICRARNINISGGLKAINNTANNAWIDLRAESIMVMNGGILEIGTETNPYIANRGPGGVRCQITLTGAKDVNSQDRYKAIMVMDGGTIELHGKRKTSWTNIANTVNPGDRQITLKESVNWEVGDVVALTSTGAASSGGKEWEDVDQVEIESISGDGKTINITSGLRFKHVGGSRTFTRPTDGKAWKADIYGEIGLLSHYIKILGETTTGDGFGGHIMIMKGATSHSENIELYNMGQRGVLGRYPYHWHLNENQSVNSYLKNSSIHKSFNRAVVIHGTDYVTVDGVFAYDHIGHGLFLEDGAERFNTIKNNVVFVTRRPSRADRLTPSDQSDNSPQNRTPSSFWITNPHNTFENNVAAGTEGTGFWIALPHDGDPRSGNGRPMGASAGLSYFDGVDPLKQDLIKMDGFVAHTCMNGWDIFDQLKPDHSLEQNWGWRVNTNQYLDNGLFYGNETALYCGLSNGADPQKIRFRNCVFTDNRIVSMLAGDLVLENCLFNSNTDLGVLTDPTEFFRFYDGPGSHNNCHFVGWDKPGANIVHQITGGGATENFNVTFRNATVDGSIPFRFFPLPNTDDTRARKVGQFFKDYDGGLTGKAHTTIVRDIPFLTDGHEYRHPSWRNAARSDYYFASLWMARINGSGSRISIVRSKPGTDDVCFYEPGFPASGTYKFPMIVNEGFKYTYSFDKAPENKSILLIWNRGDMGDLGYACFKGLGKLGNFRINGGSRLNSIAAVEASTVTAHYIDNNGDVYAKFRALNPNNREQLEFKWDNNGSFTAATLQCTTNDLIGESGKDTDGDGVPDLDELELCRNPNDPTDLNFEFSNSDENFTRVNTNAANTNSSQVWLIRADGQNDPYIHKNSFGFSGSLLKQIMVRAQSEASGNFQLYWATEDQPNFGGGKSVSVNYTNGYKVMNFNMTGRADWEGKTITKLRLDFPADASRNVHTWIDYIKGPNAGVTNCIDPITISFSQPTQTVYEEGDDTGAQIEVEGGTIANVRLYLNDEFVRQEGGAPYQWGTAHPTAGIDGKLRNLLPGTYQLKAVVTDNEGNEITETKDITVISRLPVPGEFEAENFSYLAGEEIRVEDTPGTTGGKNLGFTKNGDVIEYLVHVTTTDEYVVQTHASSLGSGGTISFYSDDELMGSVDIPNNGAWHYYEVYSAPMSMTAGRHTLKMVYTGPAGNLFNVDKFNVVSSSVVSVNGFSDVSGIQVYPNPSEDGVFYFNDDYDYQVFDLKGYKIQGQTGNMVDLGNQNKGVYILQINNEQIKLIR